MEETRKPSRSTEEIELDLKRTERVLYARVAVGAVLFCVFVVLDITAALTHQIDERAPALLGLLIASIYALPRQVIPRKLLVELDQEARGPWVKRMQRIQTWLVYVRGVFFFSALFLFLGLPKLV